MSDPDSPESGQSVAPPIKKIGAILGALLTAGSIAEAVDLYQILGLAGFIEQRLVAMLGIALVIVYTVFPVIRNAPRSKIPWYDGIAIAASIIVCTYVSWDYENIFEEIYARPLNVVLSAVAIVVLVAEGLRRTSGNILFIFLLCFILCLAHVDLKKLILNDISLKTRERRSVLRRARSMM